MPLLGATIFAICIEYSGLHYLWKVYISKSPPAKGMRRVWEIYTDAEALEKWRKDRSKQIEKRRESKRKIQNQRREYNRVGHA